MKSLLLILFIVICCLFTLNSFSQNTEPSKNKNQLLSNTIAGGPGIYLKGFSVGISNTYLFSNNWGASISFKSNFYESKNLPDDYEDFDLFGNENLNPKDILSGLSFAAVKVFPTNNKDFKMGLELGPSIIFYRVNTFVSNINAQLFGSNYLTKENSKTTIGLIYRATTNINISKRLGLEFALAGNINEYNSIFGFETYLHFRINKQP